MVEILGFGASTASQARRIDVSCRNRVVGTWRILSNSEVDLPVTSASGAARLKAGSRPGAGTQPDVPRKGN